MGIFRQLVSVGYKGILVLHYQPSATPLHDNEGPDMVFIRMPDSIRSGESAHPAGHGHNRHIRSGKPHRHIFDGIGDAFQTGRVHFLQFLQHGLPAASPATKRIDVVPVFGCGSLPFRTHAY